jgi:excisionase family DNA binding protein
MGYLTLEETAERLKVEGADILSLIDQGKLKAINIVNHIRIPEAELDRLLVTCAAGPTAPPPSDNSRVVRTRTGKEFRASGSVAEGAEIWPGKMRYPIKLPKEFMGALLKRFPEGAEVAVGGSFSGPVSGSLGEFIQKNLPTKMNPAVYVAALLIDEGYAEDSRRGRIRFRSEKT